MFSEYDYNNTLCHYGVKGMKWGVRRSKQELKYNRNSIYVSVNNSLKKKREKPGTIVIKGFTNHAADRAAERKVSADDIRNAIRNPIYKDEKVRIDLNGRPSVKYIGRRSTVAVNPNTGNIVTVYPTSSKRRRKYERRIMK